MTTGIGLFIGVEIGRGIGIGVGAGVGAFVIMTRGTIVGDGDGETAGLTISRGRVAVGDGTGVCEKTTLDEKAKTKTADKTTFFIDFNFGELKI